MKQIEWEQCVAAVLREHPDWMAGTVDAIQHGVKMRLEDEVDKRAQAETALAVVYEAVDESKIPDERLTIYWGALMESHMFKRTEFAEEVKTKLDAILKKAASCKV